jgi:hypothetical protein
VLLSGGDKVRNLGGFLSRLSGHREAEGEQPETASRRGDGDQGVVVATKALRKFLTYLAGRQAPILLDLGPVVGSNVNFFGEQLNCKVYIEDIFADLDRHLREDKLDQFAQFLAKRFTLQDGTVDGVLIWDLLDYMDRPSAQALATRLVQLMRPDGALLGFFGTSPQGGKGFTKFVVVDEGHVRHRPYPSAAVRQRSPQNRDIIKMFEGLRVTDSFLLQNNVREILFRKGGAGRPII